ncbi:MAG: hypothetical protein ABEH58_01185 [Haloplanus sp.]
MRLSDRLRRTYERLLSVGPRLGWRPLVAVLALGSLLLILPLTGFAPAATTESGPDRVTGSNRTADPVPPVAGEGLRLAPEDIDYLNRIFRERTHEVAYCGYVDGERLRPWLADTIRANDTSIAYTTANCPTDDAPGQLLATVHTHPNGRTDLSRKDRRLLRNTSFELMCVQGGWITATPGTDARNFSCYRSTADGAEHRLREVPVSTAPTRRNRTAQSRLGGSAGPRADHDLGYPEPITLLTQ